eukprot:14138903-Ditylum_brightwellii.AAC.1
MSDSSFSPKNNPLLLSLSSKKLPLSLSPIWCMVPVLMAAELVMGRLVGAVEFEGRRTISVGRGCGVHSAHSA